MTRRTIIILSIVAGVLLVALITVGVLLAVVIGQNNKADEAQEHARAVAICERQYADPYDKDLDAMLACMDDLLD